MASVVGRPVESAAWMMANEKPWDEGVFHCWKSVMSIPDVPWLSTGDLWSAKRTRGTGVLAELSRRLV